MTQSTAIQFGSLFGGRTPLVAVLVGACTLVLACGGRDAANPSESGARSAAISTYPTCSGTSPTPCMAGGYQIDGVVDSGTPVFDDKGQGGVPGYGNAQELGPLNSSATKLGVIYKAPLPMLGYTNPNAGVDLRRVWMSTNVDATTGDAWLYLAWERDSTKGSGVIAFEFQQASPPASCDLAGGNPDASACNPWSGRNDGDFLLVWDQGGSTININLRYFSGTSPNISLGANQSLVNGTEFAAATSSDGSKGEAAVNLSQTIFKNAPPDRCLTIGNVIPGTVTGNSDTADYKDTILADFAQFVHISNCGTVQLVKNTAQAPSSATTFPVTLSRTGATDNAIRYAADGYSGANLTSAAANLAVPSGKTASNSLDIVDLIPATNYKLAESAVTGWTNDSLLCGAPGVQDTKTFTDASSSFTVQKYTTTYCTVNNSPAKGTLTITKTDDTNAALVGTPAAAFTAYKDFTTPVSGTTCAGGTAVGSCTVAVDSATGKATCSIGNIVVGVQYCVAETTTPTGYETAAAQTTSISTGGGDAPLTFVDNRSRGAVLVTKRSKTLGGSLLTGASFNVKNGSGTVVKGATDAVAVGTGVVCFAGLLPGSYTVTETAAPTGYAKADDQTATVVAGTNCSTNRPSGAAALTFVDQPLSEIWVGFRSLAGVGVTTATVTCTGEDVGAALADFASAGNPVHDLNNLATGTYTCTVTIE